MNRVWTEEELEILRRDREAKVPVPVTAAKLGRPVPATYARARLIGTLVQPHQSWNEASVARLRELVSADPPMTDKRIAAELGRTVTQIRWKMQDLGLIGVRDLSKLAKITAAETARPKAVKPQSDKPAPARPTPRMQPTQPPAASRAAPAVPTARAAQPIAPQRLDPQATLADALEALESLLAERLKNAVAESEAGMIRAARAAIAEKARIDQRLVIRVKRAAEAAARSEAEARAAEVEAKRREAEAKKAEAEAARKAAEARARHGKRKPARKRRGSPLPSRSKSRRQRSRASLRRNPNPSRKRLCCPRFRAFRRSRPCALRLSRRPVQRRRSSSPRRLRPRVRSSRNPLRVRPRAAAVGNRFDGIRRASSRRQRRRPSPPTVRMRSISLRRLRAPSSASLRSAA